jgi:CheY-like chemotaxis protein
MSASLVGVSILLVEDDDATRYAIEQCLEREGASVVPASSARAALDLVVHAALDLVITDYSMPGDTGLWLLERIRERSNRVPVILVTGDPDLHELRRAPFARVLRKPVDPDALCEEILNVLQRQR